MDNLRYPIGKFTVDASSPISRSEVEGAIEQIAQLPSQLRAAISALPQPQLDTPYREGGWTVRQTVHHLADSHMNSYIRFRLALTEEKPTIKPYDEKAWAELIDARAAEVESSLRLIEALHERWVMLLRSMSPGDFERKFVHPEHGERRLDWNALLYAWHGRHHLAHIASVRERYSTRSA